MKKYLRCLVLFIVVSASLNKVYSQDTLYCQTEGAPSLPLLNNYYSINGISIDGSTCFSINPKIHVIVIDSCSAIPWDNDSCVRYFGQQNYWAPCTGGFTCLYQPLHWFQFDLGQSVEVDSLISMLNNKIPNGNHLLVYTINTYHYSALPQNNSFRNAFINLGSVMMNSLPDTVPFIFYVKKGFPFTVAEINGSNASDTISITAIMDCVPASVNETTHINLELNLSPNPTTDELRVNSSEFRVDSIEIYDVFRKKVFSEQLQTSNFKFQTINVSDLSSGMYFVRVKTEKGTDTQKIIVQH